MLELLNKRILSHFTHTNPLACFLDRFPAQLPKRLKVVRELSGAGTCLHNSLIVAIFVGSSEGSILFPLPVGVDRSSTSSPNMHPRANAIARRRRDSVSFPVTNLTAFSGVAKASCGTLLSLPCGISDSKSDEKSLNRLDGTSSSHVRSVEPDTDEGPGVGGGKYCGRVAGD